MKSDDFIEIVDSIITSEKYEKNASCSSISTVDPVEAMTELIEDIISGKKSLDDLPSEMRGYEKEIEALPGVPRKPKDWECCGSGCCPCVWDIYDRDMEIHERAVMRLCEKMTEN